MGWRVIRTDDYMALQKALETERALVRSLYERIAELERTTGEQKADARAAQATRDQLLIRFNQIEAEAAQIRSRVQGIKAVVPQQLSGAAAMPEGGVINFEDVGDKRAAELRAAGLLEDEDPGPGPAAEGSWDAIPGGPGQVQ